MTTEPTREDLDARARALGVPNPELLPNKEVVEDAIEAALGDPAVVPEPVGPVEWTYKVVGAQPVCDTPPGGTFTATMPLEQEKLLLEGGHIQRVTKKETP
jgi:hypothetical protein